MFALQPTDIHGGVILKIQGHMTQRDIGKIHELLILKSNAGDLVNALIDVNEWSGTSFKQFIEESKLPELTDYFNKIALIASSQWIKPNVSFDQWLPKVRVKHFEPSEKGYAEEWLSA